MIHKRYPLPKTGISNKMTQTINQLLCYIQPTKTGQTLSCNTHGLSDYAAQLCD